MSNTFTVYEGNRSNSPRDVSVDEVVEKIKKDDDLNPMIPERAVNLALAQFGAFNPQTEEYREFESACVEQLISDLE